MPAATATADPPLDPPGMRSVVPRIARGAERRVLVRRAHRELIAVRLADHHRAGRFEPGDDGGVVRRNELLENLRRSGRSYAARAEVVLQRDRHAGERKRRAIGTGVDGGGLRQRALARDGVERVQRGVVRVDAIQHLAADVDRRASTASHGVAHLANCGELAHPMTRGTLNRPASRLASGALASAAVRSSDGTHRVGTVGFMPRDDARRRRNAGRVDVLDLVGVFENLAELARVQLDFFLVEPQVRERSDGFDLRSGERRGHGKC